MGYKIEKVYYRKHDCKWSFDRESNDGLRVFRFFYSRNFLGFVTKKEEQVLYIPALSDSEFEKANEIADSFISHMEEVTKDVLEKVGN